MAAAQPAARSARCGIRDASHTAPGRSRLTREATSMSPTAQTTLADIVQRQGDELLPEWIRHQVAAVTLRKDLLDEAVLREQSARFLDLFRKALRTANGTADVTSSV